MADLSISDLPDDAYAELAARADRAGVPVEDYLRAELVALAQRSANQLLIEQVREDKRSSSSHLSADSIIECRDLDRP